MKTSDMKIPKGLKAREQGRRNIERDGDSDAHSFRRNVVILKAPI